MSYSKLTLASNMLTSVLASDIYRRNLGVSSFVACDMSS